MSVTISNPTANSTVERSFPVDGDYDLTDLKPFEGEVRIYCWVTHAGEELDREYYTVPDPDMLPIGPWNVTLEVDADYADCSVTARIYIGGAAVGQPYTVEHVDIETA